MKTAPITTTLEDLYPNTKKAMLRRKPWYTDKEVIPSKKKFKWTLDERAILYKLRVENNMSITAIQKFFREKNNIPIFLGEEDTSDKYSRTRLHNQIRIIRGSFRGLCYRCRKLLTKQDRARINKNKKEDPSFGLCLSCSEEVSKYKKIRRKDVLKIGLCSICVSNKVVKGHTMCQSCLSSSHRRRYIAGICGRCGDKPLAKNSISLCEDCLETNRILSARYRQKQKRLKSIVE